jgi:hypothetical protein
MPTGRLRTVRHKQVHPVFAKIGGIPSFDRFGTAPAQGMATQSQEADVAKFETIFCAMTWGLVNALLIAVTLDAAAPTDPMPTAPIVQYASTATAPIA